MRPAVPAAPGRHAGTPADPDRAAAGLVRHAGDVEHSAFVCVGESGLCEVVHVDGAECALHNSCTVVGCIDHRLTKSVGIGDEAVANAHRDEPTLGTTADPAFAIVSFGDGVLGFAGSMTVTG